MQHFLVILALFVGLYTSIQAYRLSKKNGFYTNAKIWIPFGIFVWGDGLILGPFWFISGFIFMLLSPLWILRYLLLFYTIRNSIEILYWLHHQFPSSGYNQAPFDKISWLKSNETAILFQVLHSVLTFFFLFAFIYTFF